MKTFHNILWYLKNNGEHYFIYPDLLINPSKEKLCDAVLLELEIRLIENEAWDK